MPDLFISYSRRNSDFVRQLRQMFADDGKDVWVDFEDIPLSSSWWEEIKEGIEGSDAFIFVLSPDSVASPICNFEVAHAIKHNKRIIPIVRQLLDVEDGFTLILNEKLNDSEVQILGERNLEEVARETWSSIARHNWIFFSDDDEIDANYKKLVKVLETDLDHARTHTRLLLRAQEWQHGGQASGLLLTSVETSEYEYWMTVGAEKIPRPTQLQIEYVHTSRLKHQKRQRQTLIAVSGALVVTFFLAIIAVMFYAQAETQRGNAEANAALAETNAARAETNAQEALANADLAATAQVNAEENAQRAQVQANLAATNAQEALDNAERAEFAQSKAELNGTQAANNAATANAQSNVVETQAASIRIKAIEAATAEQIAIENQYIAETAQANSALSASVAETQAAVAETQAAIAESNRQSAIRAQEAVVVENNRSRSIALAALAESELGLRLSNPDSERAIILAIAALENFGVTWQAERALGYAVAHTLTPESFFQHETEIVAIELSENGTWMVTADASGAVFLWDATTFTVTSRLTEHTDRLTSVSFSPDWTMTLTTSLDTTARIWDNSTGLARHRLRGHSEAVLGGIWSPDASRVLTFGADGETILWDAATGDILMRLEHEAIVQAADWSPDGSMIVTGADDGLLRLWSPDGTLIATYDQHRATAREGVEVAITTVAFAPDGRLVASGGTSEKIHVWNPQTLETAQVLEGHVLDIAMLAWSSNSTWLASIDGLGANSFTEENASARIWSLTDETNRFTIFDHQGVINSVAWSPNNARLASVGADGFLYITDAASGGQLLGLGESDPITVVAWSAEGDRLITGNGRGAIRVWPYWANVADLIAYARDCCSTRALTDEEARQFGVPVPTSVPLESVIVTQCENGSAAQRLYPGTRGIVATAGDEAAALNVRNRPSTLGRLDAQIPPGQTFRVIGGPTCDDRNPIAWYEIQFGLDAQTGFIAEGMGDEYFTAPLP